MNLRLALIILLLLASPYVTLSKKRKTKRGVQAQGQEEDVIVYDNEEDKQKKINQFKADALERSKDTERIEREKRKLAAEEKGLRKDLLRAVVNHGDDSKEKAQALHRLGRNVYKQERFEETFKMSQEIMRIHSVLDGKESLPYADALGNVGSVANRIKDRRLCEIVMKRQLRILLDIHGAASKEVLIQRARMMSFQISDGEVSDGMSQIDMELEMEDYEKEQLAEIALIEGDEL